MSHCCLLLVCQIAWPQAQTRLFLSIQKGNYGFRVCFHHKHSDGRIHRSLSSKCRKYELRSLLFQDNSIHFLHECDSVLLRVLKYHQFSEWSESNKESDVLSRLVECGDSRVVYFKVDSSYEQFYVKVLPQTQLQIYCHFTCKHSFIHASLDFRERNQHWLYTFVCCSAFCSLLPRRSQNNSE